MPVLAGLLALPCLNLLRSEAAGGIDLDEPCSLTVSVNIGAAGTADGNQAYLEDFNRMEIPVAAYRVADVDVTGQKFTPVEGFEGLYRKEYNHKQGLAYERYDAKEEAFSQDVTGTVTIRPTESWTLQVGSCTITVDKSGSISITAPAGITVTTPTVTVTGDVIARGVSLDNHTHTGVHGETSDAH